MTHSYADPKPNLGIIWDISITNTGDATASGPLTFTDVLPPGVKVVSIGYGTFGTGGENTPACPSLAEINEGVPLTCSMNLQSPANYPDPGPIPPGQPLAGMAIYVEVLPGSPDTLTNEFTLSGGGAPSRIDGHQHGPQGRRHATVPRRKVRPLEYHG